MKTIFLFFSILLFGCDSKSNERVIPTQPQTDILTGVWSLKMYSPGFGPQETFGPNDVIWTFTSNNTLIVTINISLSANSNIPVTTSSTFSYILNNNSLSFDSKTFPVNIVNNKMIFDKGSVSDGERIEFDKIQI